MRRRKIRKFADREQTDKQAENSSKTEATLILCGLSGSGPIEKVNTVPTLSRFLYNSSCECSNIDLKEQLHITAGVDNKTIIPTLETRFYNRCINL